MRRRLPAQPYEVTRSARTVVPRRKTRKLVRAQRLAGVSDLVPDRGQQRGVHRLACGLALLVQVQHLDQVSGLPGEFLVSHGVNVQLVAGDVLGLSAFCGLIDYCINNVTDEAKKGADRSGRCSP